jgi:hypothetical protein
MNPRKLALLPAPLLLLAACASGPKDPSGFLGDYSKLRQDENFKSDWVWLKPGVDLRDYDRVMIDPVLVLTAKGSKAETLGPEVLSKVSQAFTETLRETIDPYYSLASKPGPNVLRVRVAITDVAKASGGKPGDPDYSVGSAAMEAEILDSVTGERQAAAIDRIEGSQAGTDVPREWVHVKGAFVEWSNRLLDFLDSYHD